MKRSKGVYFACVTAATLLSVTGTLDVRYSFVSHVEMRDIIELLLLILCHLHFIASGPQRFVSHVVMRYIL